MIDIGNEFTIQPFLLSKQLINTQNDGKPPSLLTT